MRFAILSAGLAILRIRGGITTSNLLFVPSPRHGLISLVPWDSTASVADLETAAVNSPRILMARVHILTRTGPDQYSAVVHATVPSGNNAAGFPWPDCIKNSGQATIVMTVGTGAGQIAQSEANQITSGTVIEAQFTWEDNP